MIEAATDKDMISELNLSEALVADIVRKTRQAVNVGLAGQKLYFKDRELGLLYLYCRTHLPEQLHDLESYFRRTRTPEEVRTILSFDGMFLTPEDIIGARAITAHIADYKYFRLTHLVEHGALMERARRDISSFKLVVSHSQEAKSFWEDVGFEDTKITGPLTVVDGRANALPYTLFISRGRGEECWVMVSGGFQKMDRFRADAMRRFLSEDTPALPTQQDEQPNSQRRRRPG